MIWRLGWCSLLLGAFFSIGGPAAAQPSRQYAPGVLTVIAPDLQYEDTCSGPAEMVEIARGIPEMDWDPNYTAKSRTVFERSRNVTLRREIWCLEFAFKPVRSIYVDVPQATGKMQRKLVWYLVYRVRYLGGDLQPDPATDRWGRVMYQPAVAAREGRYFFPQFVLEAHEFNKSYQDRIIPAARPAIQDREVQGANLLNTVEMAREPIPLSTPEDPREVWGLATWEDLDPRIDYLSINVRGLTNAYKPVDLPDAFQPGEPPGTGRELLSRTLRLNFWRPGDALREEEDHVYYGVPFSPEPERQLEILSAYGLKERLDHLWVYR